MAGIFPTPISGSLCIVKVNSQGRLGCNPGETGGPPGPEGKEGKAGPPGPEGKEGKVWAKGVKISLPGKGGKPTTTPPCKPGYEQIEVVEL